MLTSVLFCLPSSPKELPDHMLADLKLWKPGSNSGEEPAARSSPLSMDMQVSSPVRSYIRYSTRHFAHWFADSPLVRSSIAFPRSILLTIARTPVPAVPSSSLPRSWRAALAKVPPEPPTGPGLAVPYRPGAASGHRGGRGLRGALHSFPFLEAPRALASPPTGDSLLKQLWPHCRPPKPLELLPYSPASARGASCRRGVLSEASSLSLGDRPWTGDLMMPPRSRCATYWPKGALRPDSRSPRAALARRSGAAGTAPGLKPPLGHVLSLWPRPQVAALTPPSPPS